MAELRSLQTGKSHCTAAEMSRVYRKHLNNPTASKGQHPISESGDTHQHQKFESTEVRELQSLRLHRDRVRVLETPVLARSWRSDVPAHAKKPGLGVHIQGFAMGFAAWLFKGFTTIFVFEGAKRLRILHRGSRHRVLPVIRPFRVLRRFRPGFGVFMGLGFLFSDSVPYGFWSFRAWMWGFRVQGGLENSHSSEFPFWILAVDRALRLGLGWFYGIPGFRVLKHNFQ